MKVKIITSNFRQANVLDSHAAEIERFLTINDIQTIHHISTFSIGGFRGPRGGLDDIATMIVYEKDL